MIIGLISITFYGAMNTTLKSKAITMSSINQKWQSAISNNILFLAMNTEIKEYKCVLVFKIIIENTSSVTQVKTITVWLVD